ncbi:DUF2971 domain-containing protein [Rhizobium miluonense]|uniref:DUF2971 domain-containing protein n=1 Tax=Rhizobium miluonense TaxID=411945 RepID=A0A1C3UD71_9HYPH|nr:DUF2971 domain-containing protein [Rhizobium miluonense]SCB13384.1 Protein of unknown function [Rhizobium miluonense]
MRKEPNVTLLPLAEFERQRWLLELRLKADLGEEERADEVTGSLYHFTDERGLRGIIEGESFWCTDYRHLNDPTELFHGVDAAISLAKSLPWPRTAQTAEFLDVLLDLFKSENLAAGHLRFFICSFSEHRDYLDQWRAYGDNGRGFAIGLSPKLFAVEERIGPANERVFVGPVRYEPKAVRRRYAQSLQHALDTIVAAAESEWFRQLPQPARLLFYREISLELAATAWIWNSLTSKHDAYQAEHEVRLVMLGTPDALNPYIKARTRGTETIPYVPYRMPLKEDGSLMEIVIGPTADNDAERRIKEMLRHLKVEGDVRIIRSTIPYRSF